MPSETRRFDYVVLGSGIAGLTFALRMAARGRVAIVTKKNRADSNTNWAQGGIAAVMGADDSTELHVRGRLVAGAGPGKEGRVRPSGGCICRPAGLRWTPPPTDT